MVLARLRRGDAHLRLQARGWPVATIEEAIADAVALRQQIADVIDTSRQEPDAVAAMITAWVAQYSAL